MEILPYFLTLIKKNIVLGAIITSGSFANVDLKNVEHVEWSDKAIDLKNFSLSKDDKFSTVRVIILEDSSMSIMFMGEDSKYLDNTNYYFGRDCPLREKNPYSIGDMKVNTTKKTLGEYTMFNYRTHISVVHSSVYNYAVSLSIMRE